MTADAPAAPGAGGGPAADEIGFFHLTRSPLERALPRLLAQLLERGERVYLKCPDREAAEAMDRFLWSFDPDAFLPHGLVGAGREADQPLLVGWEDRAAENGAAVAVIVAPAALPADPAACGWRRIAYLFDGGDPALVETARAAWREAGRLARRRRYWQQKEGGGWHLAREEEA